MQNSSCLLSAAEASQRVGRPYTNCCKLWLYSPPGSGVVCHYIHLNCPVVQLENLEQYGTLGSLLLVSYFLPVFQGYQTFFVQFCICIRVPGSQNEYEPFSIQRSSYSHSRREWFVTYRVRQQVKWMLSNSMAAGCGHMDGVVAIAIVFAATYLPSLETSYQQQHCQQEQSQLTSPCVISESLWIV